MKRRIPWRFTIALALCVAMAALLGEEWRRPGDQPEPAKTGPAKTGPATTGPAMTEAVTALAGDKPSDVTAEATQQATRGIVDRPLFFASRRPLPPEPPPAVQAKQELPPVLDFALVGTVMTSKARVALVKPDKSGWVQLEPGQSVGRWTVTSIDTDRITVRSGAVEQMVGVREFGAGRVLPAALRAPAGTPSADAASAPPPTAPAPPPPSSPLRRAGTRR